MPSVSKYAPVTAVSAASATDVIAVEKPSGIAAITSKSVVKSAAIRLKTFFSLIIL